MKVIFDFDDVIFNADGFKKALFDILEKEGYQYVAAMYEEYRRQNIQGVTTPFSLKMFISMVDPNISLDQVTFLYERVLGFCEHLISQEVLDIIMQVGKENCYIVTNGVIEFQVDKIRRSIGEEGFAGISVVAGSKKDDIAEICKKHSDEQVVFVDDKQKYFSDIDRDACQNLQTVLFDKSSGAIRLKTAINEAVTREGKENLFGAPSPSEISLPYQEGEIKV